MKSSPLFLLFLLCFSSGALRLSAVAASEAANAPKVSAVKSVSLVVHNEAISKISPLLFGQFFERNFGEPGPESALLPNSNLLRPEILQKMKSMDIPLIRFPGGTNVDFLDWRDMIDNAPGREGGRPVSHRKTKSNGELKEITNRFGYDEYFAQTRDVFHCKTILVVNFLDAVAGYKPMKQAALDSCGLLAYVNAPLGAKLPVGMENWPAVRAKNGHSEPYGAEYIQIGNETWVPNFTNPAKEACPQRTDEEWAARYLECLKEYIRVIREIDSEISIIIDLRMPWGAAKLVYADPYVLKNVNLMAYHIYQMQGMYEIANKDGTKRYRSNLFSTEDIWNHWTMTPAWFGEGLADHFPKDEPGLKAGLKIACTEWNWVRWGYQTVEPKPPFYWELSAAMGVARQLHGMIRAGDRLELGAQSMLVGAGWNFAAVRFDREQPQNPFFSPQGQMTNIYRHTIGREQLKLDFVNGLETLYVHFPEGAGTLPAGAALDPIASRGDGRVMLHVINRYREKQVDMNIQLDGFTNLPKTVKLHQLTDGLAPREDDKEDLLKDKAITVPLSGKTGVFHLEKPGVYMIEIPLTK